MLYSKPLSFAALLLCLGFGAASAAADDNSNDYDAPTPPKRSTLTIQGSTSDDAPIDSRQWHSYANHSTSAQSTLSAQSTNRNQSTGGNQSWKNQSADWSNSSDQDGAQDNRTADARSGSRSANRGTNDSGKSKTSRSDPSYFQEPKLLPPNVGGQPARSASGAAPSDWNNAEVASGGKHFSKNAQASYTAPGVTGNGSKTANSNPYSPSRSGMAQAQQSTSGAKLYEPIAQNSTPTYAGSRAGGSNSSVMSSSQATPSTQETVPPGQEMSMGGDWSGFEGGDCGSCGSCGGGGNCCGDCCFNPCGCCGWYGQVDYLLVRPSFSEEQAYLKRVTTTDAQENTTTTDTVVHDNFDYRSSVRMYLGYRFGCGDEIRFGYWNYGNSSHQVSGAAPEDGSIIYAGHGELNTSVPGSFLVVGNGLQMNVYDVEYIKCQCLGGGCNQCNPCGGCCPPWTLKYSAGIRVADVRRGDNTLLVTPDHTGDEAFFVKADYIGAGPRVGLEGRRFFQGGCASLFARSNLSLLIGEYDFKETRKTPPSSPTLTENFFDSHARMIPVAEIEMGGTWQWSQSVSLSAGYLFQAWWDLGQSEQIQGNVFLNPIDDSNIMAFDGLFARLEICF